MLDRARSTLARWIAPSQTRRFDGASMGRRMFGAGTFGRVNSEIGGAGQTLASRSAYLVANNPLIGNAVGNIVGEAIGSGIRPSSANPDLVKRFDEWSEAADADGRTDFYGLQALIVTDVVVRGESFVLLQYDESGSTLRVLDVEQVDRSVTRELGNGAQIVQGVEFDAAGKRVAYWISPSRLTDTFASWAPPVRVSADDVLHIFRPLMPGQVRGVPWTASIILSAGELDKLTDALLMGASVAAMFCGVITDQNDFGGEDPFKGEAQPSLEPGTLIRVGGGKTVTFSSPQQSQAVAPLLKAQIRALAAGMGLPAFMVDGDLTGANYSSLRAGLLPFRRRIEAFQYHCLVPQLLAPVWRRFLTGEMLAGTVDETADRRCDWITPKPLQVDPAKDVEADIAEITAGLASRRQKVAERGWNIDELDSEIAADRERESTLGLTFGAPQPAKTEDKPATEDEAS
ncbi:phage portal protein [Bosea sp. (in: a-proteobacteria)]|uniref:phage portal protein n=1 Tax=Bosea sp. (in: a-proteobacteria) TaxID=1871050 RepID=UPI0027344A7D|nr:phage portal protein [Bosea sp. (in: a-proteobacteria)]MDP3409030.1 phage portal protein [Bosea sp. (in: a-proteobacteria)]